MKTKYTAAAAAAAFIVLLVSSADSVGRQALKATAADIPPRVSFTVKTAQDVAANWPKAPRETATDMLRKYGAPDGITSSLLIWRDAGDFIEIIVREEAIDHRFPAFHKDTLEQVIAYEVPEDKFDDLARFDGSIIAERTRGTLASRCQNEAMNYLALNLAHDLITNRKSVEEAREVQADIIKASARGEIHPYMRGLRFHAAKLEETADPDYSHG